MQLLCVLNVVWVKLIELELLQWTLYNVIILTIKKQNDIPKWTNDSNETGNDEDGTNMNSNVVVHQINNTK